MRTNIFVWAQAIPNPKPPFPRLAHHRHIHFSVICATPLPRNEHPYAQPKDSINRPFFTLHHFNLNMLLPNMRRPMKCCQKSAISFETSVVADWGFCDVRVISWLGGSGWFSESVWMVWLLLFSTSIFFVCGSPHCANPTDIIRTENLIVGIARVWEAPRLTGASRVS